jgi:predicted RNA-binding Zn-ribbon protein involved in translation (DUF1610 family)
VYRRGAGTGGETWLESTGGASDPEIWKILQGTEKHCPKCGAEMAVRRSGKGQNAGQQFWGKGNVLVAGEALLS